jgi:hypothetical protein
MSGRRLEGDTFAEDSVRCGRVETRLDEEGTGVLPERWDVPHAGLTVREGDGRQQGRHLAVLGRDRAPAVARAQLRVIHDLVEVTDLRRRHPSGGKTFGELDR